MTKNKHNAHYTLDIQPFSIGKLSFIIMSFFFISSCYHNVDCPVTDYSNKSAKLPDWACYQVYTICADSCSHKKYLEVNAFPEKQYPGMTIPWLTGDWSTYKTFSVTCRSHCSNSDSTVFSLSLWDGNGDYTYNNRITKRLFFKSDWKNCSVPLEDKMQTPSGRMLNKKHISSVVFFTGRKNGNTVFDIQILQLR
jgi:hypothetical protein